MSSKETILIVEDDLHLMEGIREILEIHGYEVWTAPDGQAALELLEQRKKLPDLILSDIMMPRLDGYQLFQAVRANPEWVKIPFIFLTAKGERDDVMLGKGMGSDDYIVKPFEAQELLTVIEAKLRRIREVGQYFEDRVAEIKRKVLTIINHEMRTPLTYVVAYSDMLNRDYTDLLERDPDELPLSDMRTFLHGINAGANRLRRLVENFILLAELETGEAQETFSWRKERFSNYNALLHVVANQYRDQAREKQAALDVYIEEDLPPIVADSEYLTTAIECLVDNAVKFTERAETRITLRAYQEDGMICFSVTDQGRGIPEEELERIFKSFYQIDREVYEDQGAGAGLAIVKGVVRLHNGRVSVESVLGEGSTFTICIPLADEEDTPR